MLAGQSRIRVTRVKGGGPPYPCALEAPDIDGFCDAVLESLFDGFTTVAAGSFAQGFCAALDALGSRTVDFDDPVGTVQQAWADVNDFTGARPKVTAIMECVPPPKGAPR